MCFCLKKNNTNVHKTRVSKTQLQPDVHRLLYPAVCEEIWQECALSIFRQPNKVICLQHHQTKSFSLSQPLFIYRFSKALCVSGNILFSKLAMPPEMTGALEFRTPLPGQPKGHLTPITSDVMFTLFRWAAGIKVEGTKRAGEWHFNQS